MKKQLTLNILLFEGKILFWDLTAGKKIKHSLSQWAAHFRAAQNIDVPLFKDDERYDCLSYQIDIEIFERISSQGIKCLSKTIADRIKNVCSSYELHTSFSGVEPY